MVAPCQLWLVCCELILLVFLLWHRKVAAKDKIMLVKKTKESDLIQNNQQKLKNQI